MRATARILVMALLAMGALVGTGGAASAARTVTNTYDGGTFSDVGACTREGERLHWRDQNLHSGYWDSFQCVPRSGGYQLIVQHTVYTEDPVPVTWTNYRAFQYLQHPDEGAIVPSMGARGCIPVMLYLQNQGTKARCIASGTGYMLQTGR